MHKFLPRYVAAVLFAALAITVRVLLDRILGHQAAFILPTLAVMCSAWYGGFGPGIVATILGGLAGTFLFLEPLDHPHAPDITQEVQVAIFLVVGFSISWLNAALLAARRRAEENAAAAEAAHKETVSILERIGDGFMAFDADWRWTYLNRRAAELARRPREELLGKRLGDEYPAVLSNENLVRLRRALHQRRPVHLESYYAPFGAWFELDAYASSDGVSVFIRDITERKRAEEGLSQLAAIVENCDDAIIGLSPDGRILTWNAGAERIYGYTTEEVARQPVSLLLPPERRDEVSDLLERLRRGERIASYDAARLRKDGRPIRVSLTISPIRDHAGRITGASGIERDITEKRRLEEELRQAQKMESLAALAGGVAHDFNNLLTGILGNASLALEDLPPDSSVRAMLREVVHASERASHLTQQMLAYSGRGRFVVERIDVSALARETSTLLRVSLPSQTDLRLELADRLPPVEADPTQMQQLLISLIMNGFEAIQPGARGEVSVRTGMARIDQSTADASVPGGEIEPGCYVCLEVRDTGSGIPEDVRPRIFDPFFTTKFTGRGLGLSAVLGIVRGHRGGIQVESRLGRGTTFRVLLPAAEVQAERTMASHG